MKNVNKKNIDEKRNNDKKPVSTWNAVKTMREIKRFIGEYPWLSVNNRHHEPFFQSTRKTSGWMEKDTRRTAIDLIDNGQRYKIIAEMPGVDKDDINVSISSFNLSIHGKTMMARQDNDPLSKDIMRSNIIRREMIFPEEVNPQSTEASLKEGLLIIKVDKKKNMSVKKMEKKKNI